MTKISVTRGLAELKLLDKRINDATKDLVVGTVMTPCGAYPNNKTKDQFINDCKAKYQSVIDLIIRRDKFKAAIVASNAATFVCINNNTITVANAIEQKSSIKYDEKLLSTLRLLNGKLTANFDTHNDTYTSRLDQLLKDKKGGDIAEITKNFASLNKPELINAIDVNTEIDKLAKDIDEFNSQVDFILSESNARTEIEV
jgi:hypothetical protein